MEFKVGDRISFHEDDDEKLWGHGEVYEIDQDFVYLKEVVLFYPDGRRIGELEVYTVFINEVTEVVDAL